MGGVPCRPLCSGRPRASSSCSFRALALRRPGSSARLPPCPTRRCGTRIRETGRAHGSGASRFCARPLPCGGGRRQQAVSVLAVINLCISGGGQYCLLRRAAACSLFSRGRSCVLPPSAYAFMLHSQTILSLPRLLSPSLPHPRASLAGHASGSPATPRIAMRAMRESHWRASTLRGAAASQRLPAL